MNTCDQILDMLDRAGVRELFGAPGDVINSLVEAIRRRNALEFVRVRHEEAGAFAASAQAKLDGRLGVCVSAPPTPARSIS